MILDKKENIELNLLTMEKFSHDILQIKKNNPDECYIDIITDYAEDHEIEIDRVPFLISQNLKSLLEEECSDLHLIIQESKLNIF